MATILVVDDELGIRALLSEILSDEGHTVEVAENAATARIQRERVKPDLVLLDIWMPDVDGVTLLKEWSAGGQLTMPVIMMSGHGTIDTAVEATKFGAHSFLEKPITMQKLLRTVEQALSKPATPAARGQAPVHLATVTPITAASSYSQGLATQHASPLRTEMVAPMVAAEVAHAHPAAHHAPVAPQPAYAYGAPAHHASAHPHAMGAATPAMHHAPLHVSTGPSHEQLFQLDRPLREARDDFERAYFEFHLAREGGSMTRVAEKTGLERTHLYRKLKQLGVDLGRAKKSASN
ncbi:response regulator [Aquabacterium sp. A3]|uniref:response regulator n=1 Tax=Aquabacterium sp. A3 TaxID=3132829 RepID=UPI0031196C5E